MKHPKRVKQDDRSGCGIACVACVASVSYSHVKRIAYKLFDWPKTKTSGFYTKSEQLISLLKVLELKAGKSRSVKKWTSLPPLAIVAVNLNKKGYWHWVVFSSNEDDCIVLDPRSKSAERRDFNRMRLKSCIPIEK